MNFSSFSRLQDNADLHTLPGLDQVVMYSTCDFNYTSIRNVCVCEFVCVFLVVAEFSLINVATLWLLLTEKITYYRILFYSLGGNMLHKIY